MIWSTYIIGKADVGEWWHSSEIQYAIIAYISLHTLYCLSIFAFGCITGERRSYYGNQEVEESLVPMVDTAQYAAPQEVPQPHLDDPIYYKEEETIY